MKRFLIGMTMACMAGPASAAINSLPGVSDAETTFLYDSPRSVVEFYVGKGDVVFVRTRTNDWYRIALNRGCLNGRTLGSGTISFDADGAGRVDRSSRVAFNGDVNRSCLIDSIRRSAAPPQVDSESVVTLD